MVRKQRGFGSTPRGHLMTFRDRLRSVEGYLDSAERVLRGGDCHAMVESATSAFQEYGEAHAHYRETELSSKTELAQRWIDAGRRLNLLRQTMKSCVR